MFTRTWQLGAAVLLAAILMFSGGCGTDRVTSASIRREMSPELMSIAETREQRKNRHARTFDTNLRQIWDDLDHILLLEHPVWFSEYPIP